MSVQQIKHAAKLAEWKDRILACRSSGMPVQNWCHAQGINVKTYYRWERLYMAEAIAHLPSASEDPHPPLIRIEPERLPVNPEAVQHSASDLTSAGIVLRYGSIVLEIPVSMPPAQIAELLKAMSRP